jgi:hypothetical protein
LFALEWDRKIDMAFNSQAGFVPTPMRLTAAPGYPPKSA